MNVTQAEQSFRPIQLTLHTAQEAHAFFEIMRKLKEGRDDVDNLFTAEECRLILWMERARDSFDIVGVE